MRAAMVGEDANGTCVDDSGWSPAWVEFQCCEFDFDKLSDPWELVSQNWLLEGCISSLQ